MNHLRYGLFSIAVLFMVSGVASGAERREYAATIDKDGKQRINVQAGSYFFNPNYIIVKVNVPVELHVKKEGIVPHDFVMKSPDAGLDVNVDLSSEPRIVTFTPLKTGSFPFYCQKKMPFMSSHREKGMEGVIEVRP